ncbi:uncharacterized protein F4822DRAFT_435523 [Hypoxylon trugodes]|uniref:uncharacterized protein n=1 Tax=Hypoxylon trugodes TaxID=326681 RepID=UPI00218EF918|nr:uncharacterized protein F4822DRAFT_435523 [Hypoxylon trugodes]KAI1382495.1 hypothetical protein F4822DRAFT_435523 [Hypoxylon trugodes]
MGCIPDLPGTSSLPESAKNTIWTIPVIMVGTILPTATVVFLIMRRIKARQYRRACDVDPLLSRAEFSRRWKMSAAQQLREDEHRRKVLIQQALTKRLREDEMATP